MKAQSKTNQTLVALVARMHRTFQTYNRLTLPPRVQLRGSKGNAGACFATQPSAELLQNMQLEVLQSTS